MPSVAVRITQEVHLHRLAAAPGGAISETGRMALAEKVLEDPQVGEQSARGRRQRFPDARRNLRSLINEADASRGRQVQRSRGASGSGSDD